MRKKYLRSKFDEENILEDEVAVAMSAVAVKINSPQMWCTVFGDQAVFGTFLTPYTSTAELTIKHHSITCKLS